jgi:hypothetical protein
VTFEVPVAPVAPSAARRGMTTAVALTAVAIVAAAGLSGWFGPTATAPAPNQPQPEDFAVADAAGRGTVRAPAGPASARPFIPRIVTASVARRMPDVVTCNGDVDGRACERLVRAALRVVPADLPDVTGASVWRSLVCNDTFDCPPAYLRDSVAMGSVILEFADDGPRAAVNVVDWRYGTSIRLGLRAWIARSTPAGS